MNYLCLLLSLFFFGAFWVLTFNRKDAVETKRSSSFSEEVVADFRPFEAVEKDARAEDEYWRMYFDPKVRLSLEDVGRRYEFYVGYWLEVKGYDVGYAAVDLPGSTVDLIARKDGAVMLVQCKYLSRRKGNQVQVSEVYKLRQAIEAYPKKEGERVSGKIFTSSDLSREAYGVLRKMRQDGVDIAFEKYFAIQTPYPIVKGVSHEDGRLEYLLPCDRDFTKGFPRSAWYARLEEARALGFSR